MRYVIVSDAHFGSTEYDLKSDLEKELLDFNAKYLIVAGDLTVFAAKSQYDQAFKWLSSLSKKGTQIILTVGNHDVALSMRQFNVPREEGYERFSRILDEIIMKQPIVAARNDLDLVYRIERDVFYAPRTTHRRFYKGTRVSKEQMAWAKSVLRADGLAAENGRRLHLLTHQSLWKLNGSEHDPLEKRERLVEGLLKPLDFVTAINGHNHRFTYGMREVGDTGKDLFHIQAPTLNPGKDKGGKGNIGFVRWDSDASKVDFIEYKRA